jgi:hypothetical protein
MPNNQPATDTDMERVDDEQLRVLFQRICQAWTNGDAERHMVPASQQTVTMSPSTERARKGAMV